MAVYEKSGVLNWIDKNGNKNILYPVTTTDNVDGLDTELAGKVDKTSIVDNLTSTDTDKPLSANQGKVLKDEVNKKQATLVSGTNIKTINGESILGKGDMSIESGSSSATYSNISVNVTPTALSSYCAWDTQQLYGYKATVTINGLTVNSLIQNIVMTDTLLASVGYIVTTGANSLTFYTQDNTALSGTIITLVTSEVA